ncbi:hypothetical protein D9757_013447 [Collybiopsis confluens]|uniref:Hydrophobin n=1 Tax=Collybiopsis confluens TaxID=2823264 RepID=A0A8H5FR31_9AGAR|nr:hypothetical protein D9757_013447 [Collybiopsis confluens]
MNTCLPRRCSCHFGNCHPAAPRDTCSTGAVQCCNTLTTANDPAAANILGSLGVVLKDLNVGVGLDCDNVALAAILSGGWWTCLRWLCPQSSFKPSPTVLGYQPEWDSLDLMDIAPFLSLIPVRSDTRNIPFNFRPFRLYRKFFNLHS